MKIISWNVNGLRACLKHGLLNYVEAEKPDVLCVQETKASVQQCPEMQPDSIGYSSQWHSAQKPGYSGVATFVKEAPESWSLGMGIGPYDQEGRVLISDWGSFRLLNLYLPNGAASEERHLFKMKFMKDFLQFSKKLDQEKPLVICGDVNIAHRAVDIHDPVRLDGTSGFMPEEREWMDDYLKAGFVDCFRLKYPEARDQYSWWSYRALSRPRNKGWRIDYFLISERWKDRVQDMRMDQKVKGSDHCPLVLELSA